MAHKGIKIATPSERRPSKADIEGEGDMAKILTEIREIRREMKESEMNIREKLTEIVTEFTGQMKELNTKIHTVEEQTKKAQKEVREYKKEGEKLKGKMDELEKVQELTLDNLALLEMNQKAQNVKIRGLIEEEGEDLRAKISKEIANLLGWKTEEIEEQIINVFRIRANPPQGRTKKYPGDCLVTLGSVVLRNEILRKSRESKWIINGKQIIAFRDIPKRILHKRNVYKGLTKTLEINKIRFRWEYPQGVSFYYKDKKFKIDSVQEMGKFGRRYKELGKIEGVEVEESGDEKDIQEQETKENDI